MRKIGEEAIVSALLVVAHSIRMMRLDQSASEYTWSGVMKDFEEVFEGGTLNELMDDE